VREIGTHVEDPLRPEFEEARGCEVLVEGQCFSEAPVAHHLKAGRVDKRVGAFVVLA